MLHDVQGKWRQVGTEGLPREGVIKTWVIALQVLITSGWDSEGCDTFSQDDAIGATSL